MKHLKYFEYQQEEYKKPLWIIKTDQPYLDISIDKLNLSPQQKKYLLDNDYINHRRPYTESNGDIIKFDKIYIRATNKIEDASYWDYYQNGFEEDITSQTRDNMDFKGEVEITPDDIKEWEINNTANKYNL